MVFLLIKKEFIFTEKKISLDIVAVDMRDEE